MKHSSPPASEHQEVWDLLPWLVNGRLCEADRRRVEVHLSTCRPCQEELADQRHLYQVMSADGAVEQLPAAGLNKLRQRLETYERTAEPLRRESGAASRARSGSDSGADSDGRRRSLLRWRGIRWSARARGMRQSRALAAASATCIAVVLGVMAARLWDTFPRHGDAAAYHTVTLPAQRNGDAIIRAVFAPSVTLSELQAMLDDARLRIVSGPTEAGVYSLAMTGAQPLDWSLRRLRKHGSVRFAESIGDPPIPP